jgi:hypothetical protein
MRTEKKNEKESNKIMKRNGIGSEPAHRARNILVLTPPSPAKEDSFAGAVHRVCLRSAGQSVEALYVLPSAATQIRDKADSAMT